MREVTSNQFFAVFIQITADGSKNINNQDPSKTQGHDTIAREFSLQTIGNHI